MSDAGRPSDEAILQGIDDFNRIMCDLWPEADALIAEMADNAAPWRYRRWRRAARRLEEIHAEWRVLLLRNQRLSA